MLRRYDAYRVLTYKGIRKMIYFVPALTLAVFVFGAIKKVNVYDSFTEGIKEAVGLTIKLIPYLATVFMLMELMRSSGLSAFIGRTLSPAFQLLGIPKELSELIILRPLTGSGSLAVLQNIYLEHGVDSYISRTASVIMGSTDTVMYIAAVYFSGTRESSSGKAVGIALAASFIGAISAALICRIM